MHQDHNLLGRYALDRRHPEGAFNDSGYFNILIAELLFCNPHTEVFIEPHTDFVIFRIGSELSRHEIESLKRENFCNSIIVQWKNSPRQKVTLSDQLKRVTRLMDSKSEQWEILDNSPSPDNYMFQCLEQKLRASGKRQIICDSWSRRESKIHLNVIKLKTTK